MLNCYLHLQSSVVLIRGLSENTTEDGLLNYLENTRRSGGGPVKELKINGNSARVEFESSEGNLKHTISDNLRQFYCPR